MKKFFKEIWNVVKLFPLTSCGIFVLMAAIFVQETNATYDSQGLSGGLFLLLILLSRPFQLINNLANFLHMSWLINFFKPPLLGTCFFLLLLDLLLLSLRTGSLKNLLKKTYHKLTKPKK